jgi:hypothetical protein
MQSMRLCSTSANTLLATLPTSLPRIEALAIEAGRGAQDKKQHFAATAVLAQTTV